MVISAAVRGNCLRNKLAPLDTNVVVGDSEAAPSLCRIVDLNLQEAILVHIQADDQVVARLPGSDCRVVGHGQSHIYLGRVVNDV